LASRPEAMVILTSVCQDIALQPAPLLANESPAFWGPSQTDAASEISTHFARLDTSPMQ
jgi:hypothetical protein